MCAHALLSTGRSAPGRASYFQISIIKLLNLINITKYLSRLILYSFFFFFFLASAGVYSSNSCNGSTLTLGGRVGGPAFPLNLPRSCTQSLGSVPDSVLGVSLDLKAISLRRASLQSSDHNTYFWSLLELSAAKRGLLIPEIRRGQKQGCNHCEIDEHSSFLRDSLVYSLLEINKVIHPHLPMDMEAVSPGSVATMTFPICGTASSWSPTPP